MASCGWLRSLLCLCGVFRALIISLVCWFSAHRILQKLTKSVPHWAIFFFFFFYFCTFLHQLFHEMQATSHNIQLNDNPDRSAKSCNKSVCVCVCWGVGGGGGGRLRWSWVKKHQKWFLCYLYGTSDVWKLIRPIHQQHTNNSPKTPPPPPPPPPPPTLKPCTHWCRHLHCCHPQENQQIYTTA